MPKVGVKAYLVEFADKGWKQGKNDHEKVNAQPLSSQTVALRISYLRFSLSMFSANKE